MQLQPRFIRAVRKVVRLNVRSPQTARVALIRTIPLVVTGPHDLTGIEQMAACDTLSLIVQVGIIMYKLS
jgi:hypothetical protein